VNEHERLAIVVLELCERLVQAIELRALALARVAGVELAQARHERPFASLAPPVMGDQVASDTVEPGLRVRRHLVESTPCHRERLGDDVVRTIRRTPERVGEDVAVMLAKERLESRRSLAARLS
jgi:hypothetical protein